MARKGDNMVARVRLVVDVPFTAAADTEKERSQAAKDANELAKTLHSKVKFGEVVDVFVEEVRDR